MKKLVTAVFVAVLAVFGGKASGQDATAKKIKIGITMPTADHGWMGGANWSCITIADHACPTVGGASTCPSETTIVASVLPPRIMPP